MGQMSGIVLQKQDGTLLLEGTGHVKVFQDTLQVNNHLVEATRGDRGDSQDEISMTQDFIESLTQLPVTLTW